MAGHTISLIDILDAKLQQHHVSSLSSLNDIKVLLSVAVSENSSNQNVLQVIKKNMFQYINKLIDHHHVGHETTHAVPFFKLCIPHCPLDLVREVTSNVMSSDLDLLLRLEILHQILSSCESGDKELEEDVIQFVQDNMRKVLDNDDTAPSKKCGQILRSVWMSIDADSVRRLGKVMDDNDDDYPSTRYIIMCTLIDCFIETGLYVDHLWLYLLKGFKSRESMIRKQCVYMIKTVLDAFDKGLIDNVKSYLMILNKERQRQILEVWSDLILLIESLNEKQVHIVQPNFCRISSILKGVQDGDLHIDWLIAVFTRVLEHDNNQVRRFGVLYILNIDFAAYKQFTSEGPLPVLYEQFVTMTNVASFFVRRPDMREAIIPEVFTAMKNYLSSVLKCLSGKEHKAQFLHGIVVTLSNSPWSPVPCMYWLAALASLDQSSLCGCWDGRTLSIILDMISKNLLLSDKRIRMATQCYLLSSVLLLCEMNDETIDQICTLIVGMRADRIFRYNSSIWNQTKSVLQSSLSSGSISLDYLLHSDMSMECIIRYGSCKIGEWVSHSLLHLPLPLLMTLLFHYTCVDTRDELAPLLLIPDDTSSEGPSTTEATLPTLTTSVPTLTEWLRAGCVELLSTCSMRAYAKQESIIGAMRTMVRIHLILSSSGNNGDTVKRLESMLAECEGSVYDYLISIIRQKQKLELSELESCLDFVKLSMKVSSAHQSSRLISDVLSRLDEPGKLSDLEWLILEAALDGGREIDRQSCIQALLKVHTTDSRSSRSLHQLHTLWVAYHAYLTTPPTDFLWTDWYTKAMDALSIMYRQDSCVVFRCLSIILPKVEVDEVEIACNSMLMKAEEESKNSHYLPLVSVLVSSVFSRELVAREDCQGVLDKVFGALYNKAEERPGIANIISRQLSQVFYHNDTGAPDWLMSALVNLAMYGPIHNKAQRTIEDAFLFLSEDKILSHAKIDDEKRVGWNISDQQVRVLVIDSFIHKLNVDGGSQDPSLLLTMIIDKICTTYTGLLMVKCYNNFPNALSHRQRHRLLSLLLVLLSHIIKIESVRLKLMDFVLSALRIELQPSCRHQLEWMYIYILKSFPHDIKPRLLDIMTPLQMAKEKAFMVCSMFSVASHLCAEPALNDAAMQFNLMVDIIPLITPWGMSSKFNMRIHAQAALMKIWHHAQHCDLSEKLAQRFPILSANMQFALLSGTATEKNSRKLLENFFFFKFDAVKDWSLEAIFELWPRLLSLAEGECVPAYVFSKETRQTVPVSCHHIELRTCDPGTWHVKVKEGDNETELSSSGGGDVQRKITAWRTTNPALDPTTGPECDTTSGLESKEGLILVTSLIDKLPNLGGLCRTAEIFGVSEMVVNSLKMTEDTNFLSTSVTAHQWIPLKQVPAYCLPDYLAEMKQYGYTIIGAEQSTNSKSLKDYQMPLKTVLLLGNEKQGIPAELLQLLDVCVEIPQQGVIRSLNVHVSGALLIWEYRKQRLLQQDSNRIS